MFRHALVHPLQFLKSVQVLRFSFLCEINRAMISCIITLHPNDVITLGVFQSHPVRAGTAGEADHGSAGQEVGQPEEAVQGRSGSTHLPAPHATAPRPTACSLIRRPRALCKNLWSETAGGEAVLQVLMSAEHLTKKK